MTPPMAVLAERKPIAVEDCPLTRAFRCAFGLTRMEARVARAIAGGLTYREIAARFSLSYHTVHSHVKAIHRKAGVPSNIRLLALIRKEGLE
jgi:DNA-binding CsgD family transcriptional regulator